MTADPRRPTSGMDPMPSSRPRPPHGGPDPTAPLPDDVPDPRHPGRPGPAPSPGGDGIVLVAAGREDRLRHVVDVAIGELGDPEGLRARCGAAVGPVVPGLGPAAADCPVCGATSATG